MRVFVLLLLASLAGPAFAAPREMLIAGWDQERGWFSGRLSIGDADVSGRVTVERLRRFTATGNEELLQGEGRLRGNWVRAILQRSGGALAALEGRATSPIVLQLKLDLATGAGETVSWADGRKVSRARGRTVSSRPTRLSVDPSIGDVVNGRLHLLTHDDPLDPFFVDPVGNGEPSLEGTDAEGYKVYPGVPFVKATIDDRPVHPNDVAQGSLGDCYVLAALIAVARTDPEVIERMITSNDDGTYTVFLWDVGPFSRDARVTIDATFPYQTRGGQKAPVFASLGDRETVNGKYRFELWPMIIEKAWAKYRGSYLATEDWHSSGPLSFVSGAPVSNLDPADMTPAAVIAVLQEANRQGYPTVLSTDTFEDHPERAQLADDLGMIDFHAYTLMGTTQDGRIRLWNPWGVGHPVRALTGEELHSLAMCIHIGRF
jgi:hypothetical protein